MKQESKEWWKAIWKLTKAVLRLFFVIGSIVLGYLSVGIAKVAEFCGAISDRLL